MDDRYSTASECKSRFDVLSIRHRMLPPIRPFPAGGEAKTQIIQNSATLIPEETAIMDTPVSNGDATAQMPVDRSHGVDRLPTIFAAKTADGDQADVRRK